MDFVIFVGINIATWGGFGDNSAQLIMLINSTESRSLGGGENVSSSREKGNYLIALISVRRIEHQHKIARCV